MSFLGENKDYDLRVEYMAKKQKHAKKRKGLKKKPKIGDTVNHPKHYNRGRIECIEFLEDQFMDRPHEWNAVKYITRADLKGKEVEDLEKAIWYLRRKLELLRGTGKRPNQMPQARAA